MLVNSVIIVLREVLEAALMISILLALAQRTGLGRRWLLVAFLLGSPVAVAYASLLGPISDLFGGVGQELTNAAMQFGVFGSLVVVVLQVARGRGGPTRASRVLPIALASSVTLSVAQEGAEIFVYVAGFMQMDGFVSSVTIGSLTGAAIGFSVGVLFYYLLLALPGRRALAISLILLGLIGASMCIQATSLLIQADWLQSGPPLWDTSALIAEQSLIGQLLYALAGYEASPSAMEAIMYLAGLASVVTAAVLGWRVFPASDGRD
jgi:high-affinity iron transporter